MSVIVNVLLHGSQLSDALKKKFTKCDHIDVDWGVGDGGEAEEEIYQTPVIDSQMSSAVPGPSAGSDGTLKKSETVGNFQDEKPKGENRLVLIRWKYGICIHGKVPFHNAYRYL
jgi:hypothetical protein